ncbi:MAG: hypothetical protein L3J43_11065 [Sulfurovum sp.]|nr:hypothetical protein [Sulfurovum sp.]
MKLTTILFLIILTISGCTETPEVSRSQESLTREKIELNKTEASEAKKEYLKLQKLRK